MLNTTALLVGSLVLIGGLVALSVKLWHAGRVHRDLGSDSGRIRQRGRAWTAYVLTIPFMVFVLPYFLGAVLLSSKAAERTLPMDDFATDTTVAGFVREPR